MTCFLTLSRSGPDYNGEDQVCGGIGCTAPEIEESITGGTCPIFNGKLGFLRNTAGYTRNPMKWSFKSS